jgi:hypothetical protein
MSKHRLTIAGICNTGCEVRVTAERHAADLQRFNGTATLTGNTGACGVQTYLTAEECERMADIFTEAARSLRAMEVSEAA